MPTRLFFVSLLADRNGITWLPFPIPSHPASPLFLLLSLHSLISKSVLFPRGLSYLFANNVAVPSYSSLLLLPLPAPPSQFHSLSSSFLVFPLPMSPSVPIPLPKFLPTLPQPAPSWPLSRVKRTPLESWFKGEIKLNFNPPSE